MTTENDVIILKSGIDALACRIELIKQAQKTIEIQTYIWRNDASGTIVTKALIEAADRGVEVRILLDDHGSSWCDDQLQELDNQKNISIKIFNPLKFRQYRFLNFLTDFQTLNYRMHNKSFVVDGTYSIVGGRNVGDEYFIKSESSLFIDLEVLVVGQGSFYAQKDFDKYWDFTLSKDFSKLKNGSFAKYDYANRILIHEKVYLFNQHLSSKENSFTKYVNQQKLHFKSKVALISDNPDKSFGLLDYTDGPLLLRIFRYTGIPKNVCNIISAYFAPSSFGADLLSAFAMMGAKLTVVTNSLQSSDVPFVHAGYIKHRKRMLQAGIEIFEFKQRLPKRLKKQFHFLEGSGNSSLHAKTITIDNLYTFVGSFNFDARSSDLNCEMGYIIESTEIAKVIDEYATSTMKQMSYIPQLVAGKRIVWKDGSRKEKVYFKDPEASFWKLLLIKFVSKLPIDHLL